MKNTTILTAVTFAALTGMAQAGSYTPPVVDTPYVPAAPAAHDWTGWYGDVYAGHWINPPVGNYLGFNLGYLTGNGSMVYGGELGLLYDPSAAYRQFTIDGRLGVAAGTNGLLFANLGLGRDSGATNFVEYSIGGQYAFGANMYARGEIVGQRAIGGILTTSSVRLGIGLEF